MVAWLLLVSLLLSIGGVVGVVLVGASRALGQGDLMRGRSIKLLSSGCKSARSPWKMDFHK